jgi:Spy/CpxP family protein refolding chaperone
MTVSKMHKRWLAAVAAVTVLASAGVVLAGDPAANGPPAHEHPPGLDPMWGGGMLGPQWLGRMADELGLSAEQRQTIKGLFEAARPQLQAMRESVRSNTDKLRGTMPDDPNYATVVAQVSQAAGELASRMVTEGSQLRSQVYAVLTKDQKAKLPQIEAQMREHTRDRFKNHYHSGAPAVAPSSSPPST